jgi:hypothetical protein
MNTNIKIKLICTLNYSKYEEENEKFTSNSQYVNN